MTWNGYPVVRYDSGKLHAVNACGTSPDGSLYHFFTLCGLRITDPSHPRELDDVDQVTCKTCQRRYEKHEPQIWAEIVEAVEQMVAGFRTPVTDQPTADTPLISVADMLSLPLDDVLKRLGVTREELLAGDESSG